MVDSQIQSTIYVDNDQQLNDLCRSWSLCDVLILDTEFIRTQTFYPIAGLIQLSDGNNCYLIDPLSISDFSSFAELLSCEKIIKVLHSCSEDLDVFHQLMGVIPTPILDTQIGAAIAGYGFSLSYQKIVGQVLGIHIEKGETRSDWLQRPLTESQYHYAVLDVLYLSQVYEHLLLELDSLGRQQWWLEECSKLSINYYEANKLEEYYLKVKSAWKLSRPQLNCLQKLTVWREQQARELNRPRGRILKDNACFELAQKLPDSLQKLSFIKDVPPGIVRKYGDDLLEIIQSSLNEKPEQFPQRLPRPLPPAAGSVLKSLKALVKEKAEQLNVPTEVLIRKKDYEGLIRSGFVSGEYSLPEGLKGWRESVVGESLIAALQVHKSS